MGETDSRVIELSSRWQDQDLNLYPNPVGFLLQPRLPEGRAEPEKVPGCCEGRLGKTSPPIQIDKKTINSTIDVL